MEIEGKITFLFAALGALAGCIFGLISVKDYFPSGGGGFFVGLLFFLISFYIPYKVTPSVLRIHPAEFPGGKWTYLSAIKKGFSSFFIMWLTLWILVYTVLL